MNKTIFYVSRGTKTGRRVSVGYFDSQAQAQEKY